jgi:hypothetical protein
VLPNSGRKGRANVGTQVGLRKKSGLANVRSAGKAHHARARGKERPDISPTDAFAIIRSGLNESRPATAFDWDRIEKLLSNHSQEAPTDAITLKQYTHRLKVAETTGRRALAGLVKQGHLETGVFLDRETRNITRYWWSKKEPTV